MLVEQLVEDLSLVVEIWKVLEVVAAVNDPLLELRDEAVELGLVQVKYEVNAGVVLESFSHSVDAHYYCSFVESGEGLLGVEAQLFAVKTSGY